MKTRLLFGPGRPDQVDPELSEAGLELVLLLVDILALTNPSTDPVQVDLD
jgi:hypothetical protein